MLRLNLEPAFILHRRPWRESSELLELFSRHHGRLGAILRSSRGQRRAQRGNVQAFTPVLLSGSGREEGLLSVRSLEATSGRLLANGGSVACGFYLNELLMYLLPRGHVSVELFDAYMTALGALSRGEAAAPWLRWVEYQLLLGLGEVQSLEFSLAQVAASDDRFVLNADLSLHPMATEQEPTISIQELQALVEGDAGSLSAGAENALRLRLAPRISQLLGGRRLHSRDMLTTKSRSTL